jgi:hypothetical protein
MAPAPPIPSRLNHEQQRPRESGSLLEVGAVRQILAGFVLRS